MEYGLIPTINQYADNKQILIQQVEPLNSISKLKNSDEAKEIVKEKFLKPEEVTATKKVDVSDIVKYQEVALTNLNFGFNDSSHDFFVRAIRGESQNQYPTDEMMKLKAFFIAQAKAELADN